MVYTLLIVLLVSMLYYLLTSFLSKKIIFKGGAVKRHPFELFIFIKICIFSLPGVLLISFFGLDSWRYANVDSILLLEIGLWYLYSIFVLLAVVFLLASIFPIRNYSLYTNADIDYQRCKKGLWGLFILTISFTIAKFIILPSPPAIYFLKGDLVQGYLVRVDMQNNPSKYYLPYIKQFLELLVMLQGYLGFYLFLNTRKVSPSIALYAFFSILVCVWECFYVGQKAPILFYFIGLIFLYAAKNKVNIRLVFSLSLIPILTVYLFAFITELNIDDAIISMVDRVFLGQNQGFYNIISLITPSDKYHFEGMPLINRFGLDPSRADVDVLPLIYGSRSDLVNSNSYYLGQAWSMFGYWGVSLSPFIVALVIFSLIKFLDYITPLNPLIIIPCSFYMIFDIRINQSFSYFLFGKTIILNIIFLLLICWLYNLFNSNYSLKRRL